MTTARRALVSMAATVLLALLLLALGAKPTAAATGWTLRITSVTQDSAAATVTAKGVATYTELLGRPKPASTIALDLLTPDGKPLPATCGSFKPPSGAPADDGSFTVVFTPPCNGSFLVVVDASAPAVLPGQYHSGRTSAALNDYRAPVTSDPGGGGTGTNGATGPGGTSGTTGGTTGGTSSAGGGYISQAPSAPDYGVPGLPSVDDSTTPTAITPPAAPGDSSTSTTADSFSPTLRYPKGRAAASDEPVLSNRPSQASHRAPASSLNTRLLWATIAGAMLAGIAAAQVLVLSRRARKLDEGLPRVA